MKYTELDNFVKEHGLLVDVEAKPGIYAITVDNVVVYIGQSDNVKRRCGQHIYKTQNGMIVGERKYELLLAAQLGGHRVDCRVLKYCSEDELLDLETKYITICNPLLNIQKSKNGKNVYNLKIDDIINLINEVKLMQEGLQNE